MFSCWGKSAQLHILGSFFICKGIFPPAFFLPKSSAATTACLPITAPFSLACCLLISSIDSQLGFLAFLFSPAPLHLQELGSAQWGQCEINQVWKNCLFCAHMMLFCCCYCCFFPSTLSEDKCVQNCCEIPQRRADRAPSQSCAMPVSGIGTHMHLTANRTATADRNKTSLSTAHAGILMERRKESEMKRKYHIHSSLSLLNTDVLYHYIISLHLVWNCGKPIKAEGAASADHSAVHCIYCCNIIASHMVL